MRRIAPDGNDVLELSDGWQLARSAPQEHADPRALHSLRWTPARVPGTVAGSLRAAGQWRAGEALDPDGSDWWFRTRFDAEAAGEKEEVVLALDGIATLAEVYLNGERVLVSDSMFADHALDVSRLLRGAGNELTICCRSLGVRMRERRGPRQRWRTRLVSDANLRFFRTMLLGRAPGFARGPAVVGPWRPVRLERRHGLVVEQLELRPHVAGSDGTLAVRALIRGVRSTATLERAAIELTGPSGTHRVQLALAAGADGTEARGELVVPDVELWWPHTHGTPALHRAALLVDAGSAELRIDLGSVGFRALEVPAKLERDGIQLRINGVPVFARGAVWTPLDLTMPHVAERELRRVLGSVLAAGMNMLRVPGIACYESDTFYDLCDELGILVWQDFMFANLDYPEQNEDFLAAVRDEALGVLGSLGSRPSLAVLCGGSEVAQQVAMQGLDPALADGPLFGDLLPSLVRAAGVDARYVPSTPWGGDLPFRPDRGVAHYYGVGAYLRGFEDVRRSEVRFAAECLAFSNVPDDPMIESLAGGAGELTVHDPRWKAGVPRDARAGWDFEDVRDHYLRLLFELDPVALRSTDHERYLELSRAVSGEVMAEVFGEWRREASPCGGGLVLWLTDLEPGAGWGLLDCRGEPKVAYHHLRRALAPSAVWSTDEGLGGVVAHVANDGPARLRATLRIALYRDLEVPVEEVTRELDLPAHAGCAHNVEELLGRFVDVAWAYRFGPPAQDLIVISLERQGEEGMELLSQSFRLPAGRPTARERAARLGLTVNVCRSSDTGARLTVRAERFVYGMRLVLPGFLPDDDAFSLEPGHERILHLRQVADVAGSAASITALNLAGRLVVPLEPAP